MRFIVLAALATLVAGCGLPPAVTIGSYALDGVSYLVSGKSVSDHALSQIVGEDCATWRLVTLESPCRGYEDGDADGAVLMASAAPDAGARAGARDGTETDGLETAVAANGVPVTPVTEIPLEPAAGTPQATEIEADGAQAGEDAGAAARRKAPAPDSARARSPLPAPRETNASHRGGRYLVIGSFARRANAERLARSHGGLVPAVVATRLAGVTYYRVVVRLAPGSRVSAARRRLAAAGIRRTWLVPACGPGPARPDCLPDPAPGPEPAASPAPADLAAVM